MDKHRVAILVVGILIYGILSLAWEMQIWKIHDRSLQAVLRKSTAASELDIPYVTSDGKVLHLTGEAAQDYLILQGAADKAIVTVNANGGLTCDLSISYEDCLKVADYYLPQKPASIPPPGTNGAGGGDVKTVTYGGDLQDLRVSVGAVSVSAADFKLSDKEGKTVLTITPKGEITPGPGITLDEAAKQFSAYLKEYMQAGCKEIK